MMMGHQRRWGRGSSSWRTHEPTWAEGWNTIKGNTFVTSRAQEPTCVGGGTRKIATLWEPRGRTGLQTQVHPESLNGKENSWAVGGEKILNRRVSERTTNNFKPLDPKVAIREPGQKGSEPATGSEPQRARLGLQSHLCLPTIRLAACGMITNFRL